MSLRTVVRQTFNVLPGPLAFHAEELVATLKPDPYRRRVRERVRRLYEAAGRPTAVAQGPFRGMRLAYWPASTMMGYSMMAKFVGTYEREIWPFVEEVCSLSPDVLIDVGSADGYYIVGFARRLPGSRIVGYEMSPSCVHAMRRNYRLNGSPGRLEQRGRCDPAALRSALRGADRPVVVCDVDGYEDALIDPARVPELQRATILVEVHDPLSPGVAGRLMERFAATHEIRVANESPRTIDLRPAGCPLSDAEFLDAAREFRGDVTGLWYFMHPRMEGNAP